MKNATLVVSPPYMKDEIFKKNSPLNRDDCLEFFHILKEELSRKGYELRTQDLNKIEEADLIIYNDMPQKLPAAHEIQKSVLLIFESELIRPDNWELNNHAHFAKIMTWHNDYVDNKKYFKFNFTHSGTTQFLKFHEKNNLLTLIAGNHSNKHPFELYSKRLEAIKFYEKKHAEMFDFYGIGWDIYTFKGPKLWRAFNKIPFLRQALGTKWKNYKGKVASKTATFKNYKFSICFENAHSIPGYITEKIFDSLIAGCIPVYWGAPNITDYVPEKCFIDFRKFKDFEKLHAYLTGMSAEEYNSRLLDIESYLKSDLYEQFKPQGCVTKITDVIE